MAVETRTTDLAHHHIDLIAADAAIAKLSSIGPKRRRYGPRRIFRSTTFGQRTARRPSVSSIGSR
jgi:hypothetical protein